MCSMPNWSLETIAHLWNFDSTKRGKSGRNYEGANTNKTSLWLVKTWIGVFPTKNYSKYWNVWTIANSSFSHVVQFFCSDEKCCPKNAIASCCRSATYLKQWFTGIFATISAWNSSETPVNKQTTWFFFYKWYLDGYIQDVLQWPEWNIVPSSPGQWL